MCLNSSCASKGVGSCEQFCTVHLCNLTTVKGQTKNAQLFLSTFEFKCLPIIPVVYIMLTNLPVLAKNMTWIKSNFVITAEY